MTRHVAPIPGGVRRRFGNAALLYNRQQAARLTEKAREGRACRALQPGQNEAATASRDTAEKDGVIARRDTVEKDEPAVLCSTAEKGQPAMPRSLKETLQAMIDALAAGETPQVSAEDFPCFSPEALRDRVGIAPSDLNVVLANLSATDIPTLQEALRVLNAAESQPAWLGFKLITNPAAATDSEDTEVVGIKGTGEGSADALPGMFLVYEDQRVVFSRAYSRRDFIQMLDITRGPHMHSEQYAGVAWLSLPLETSGRVFIFGAGEVGLWVARYASDVGFRTVVLDDNPAYLTRERFPKSRRVLLDSFCKLEECQKDAELDIGTKDYVLVLTRGHMYDPEAVVYGVATGAHYVGMMGCSLKNDRVFALAKKTGVTQQQLQDTHTPIGLRFGAKTPSELAMCVVAELIKDRYDRRLIV
jgi:xanthine dehydrogenase accessory factor